MRAREVRDAIPRDLRHQLADHAVDRGEGPAAEEDGVRRGDNFGERMRRVEEDELQRGVGHSCTVVVTGEDQHARVVVLRAERGEERHDGAERRRGGRCCCCAGRTPRTRTATALAYCAALRARCDLHRPSLRGVLLMPSLHEAAELVVELRLADVRLELHDV